MKVTVGVRDIIQFREVCEGEAIRIQDGEELCYFIKTPECMYKGNKVNAISLSNGIPYYICDNVECTPYNEIVLNK